jgi:tRNA 5-methylaminomethyl-2-thiouridine biosynthesis bifunctional protein
VRFGPIVPARLSFNAQGLPFSEEFADVYHPLAGAALQARHVFLGGNMLPARWRGRERFVILETGFGLGNNFLATWDAWRGDAERSTRLHYLSVERHPLAKADLLTAHAKSPWPTLVQALLAAWPPLTPDLHRLSFDSGRVQLLLALGDVQRWLPQLVGDVDAFFLDGFAPARNPSMWEPRLYKALARLASPAATAATWSAARGVREGLRAAGFRVHEAAGVGGKRDITLAEFAPVFAPRKPMARTSSRSGAEHHAVIVGAGLAGCAAAWALAQQGWSSVVLEQHGAPAQEASGNTSGAFHGIVNRQDGAHAKFNRAAALEAQRVVEWAVAGHGVQGSARGLLRLETTLDGVSAMRSALQVVGQTDGYVQVIDAAEASRLSGLPLEHPAWLYAGGGWVDSAALARAFLDESEGRTRLHARARVESMRRAAAGWQLLDAGGDVIEQAETVVLANAGDALRLLGVQWPLRAIRGQVSLLPRSAIPTDVPLPRMPIAGAGFLLPESLGKLSFGATAQPGDADTTVRTSDHVINIERLGRIANIGWSPRPEQLAGRVGWRWSSADRLPVIGAVPISSDGSRRIVQPRLVPRAAGLYVFIGLGSRGITWAPLGAHLLAAGISGAPAPLPAALIDAVDAARFITRQARRAGASAGPAPTT